MKHVFASPLPQTLAGIAVYAPAVAVRFKKPTVVVVLKKADACEKLFEPYWPFALRTQQLLRKHVPRTLVAPFKWQVCR